MRVHVELSEEQVQQVEEALRENRFGDPQQMCTVLARLAVTAWVDWLSGGRRHTSLTQQYADWIQVVYEQLLPEDEVPSAERLYSCFNIPYGQAQYIARVLSNKSQAHWRQQALTRLKAAMGAKLPEVDEWMASGETTLNAEITLDKLAYLELKSVCERLFRVDPQGFVLPECRSSGNLCAVRIAARCFRSICEAL